MQTYKCYKYFVRGEAKARIRFRNGDVCVNHCASYFAKEELETPCLPCIEAGNVYRYFDRSTRFAYQAFFWYACADSGQKDYTEVTIFHKNKDERKYVSDTMLNGTTYFGLSAFLSARRNVTLF